MQDFNNDLGSNNPTQHQDVDIKFLVAKVIGNWYWYVLSIILFIGLGVLFALFSAPRYEVKGRVLVTGYGPQGRTITGTSEATMLNDLGLFSVPNSVLNELEIIHSQTLMNKTVHDLQLNVTYWGQGKIRYEETYKASPFFITLTSLNQLQDPLEFDVRINKNKVTFRNEDNDSTFSMNFGDSVNIGYCRFVLERNPDVTENDPKHKLGMIVNNYNNTLDYYLNNIEAITTNEFVNIIDLTLDGPTPQRGEDVLKHLINLYVHSDIDEKNKVADSTIAFINDRLISVSADLTNIDKDIESFKKQNRLTDLSEDSKVLIQNSAATASDLADKEVQVKIINDLEGYLRDDKNNTRIMPTTAPIQDPAFVQTLEKYNALQLQRQTYLANTTEANPVVQSTDIQLKQLRGDLLSMMSTYRNGINTQQEELRSRTGSMIGNIEKVPTQERVYLDFTRRQNVMQQLYSYLLTTKEQTAVSKSNNIGPIRVVDEPTRGPVPYFPNMLIIGAVAIFLGLLIPSIVIFMKELLNTKVISSDDIQNHTNVPVVAEISHSKGDKQIVVTRDSRSEIGEQFRTLRTNLQFLLPNASDKIMMTTSSMGGEGKSFVAMNLAATLALSGKKVLLMELDLRKPRISSTLNVDNSMGFSNYIVSDIKVNDVIKPSGIHPNCMLLGSGSLPPNPAELLVHPKVNTLFTEIRNQFDYVIVDCSPVGLVTDALLLSRYADIVLYVVRQRYTFKKQINMIQALANDRKFKKLDIIFNDVKALPGYGYGYGYGYSYGYKYGYGYYDEKPSFFKRLFSRKK